MPVSQVGPTFTLSNEWLAAMDPEAKARFPGEKLGAKGLPIRVPYKGCCKRSCHEVP